MGGDQAGGVCRGTDRKEDVLDATICGSGGGRGGGGCRHPVVRTLPYWQAIIVARMLHAAGLGPAPGPAVVPPAQVEALELGQDYQDEGAAEQDDTASL